MIKIGLTGGIGSGKSTVALLFHVLGIPIYEADKRAKLLMEENELVRAGIIALLGEHAFIEKKLNHTHIRNIVFSDSSKLAALNTIVHPVTIQDADVWMNAQSAPYTLKEAALIFESGSDKLLDGVIGVTAPVELRKKRIMLRDHLSDAEIEQRMAKQLNDDEKMSRCQWVIRNDEQHSLIDQVLCIHASIFEKFNLKERDHG